MIYGKSYQQKRAKKLKGELRRVRWFAWYPITLADGRRCWLQYVWKDYSIQAFANHHPYTKPIIYTDDK